MSPLVLDFAAALVGSGAGLAAGLFVVNEREKSTSLLNGCGHAFRSQGPFAVILPASILLTRVTSCTHRRSRQPPKIKAQFLVGLVSKRALKGVEATFIEPEVEKGGRRKLH